MKKKLTALALVVVMVAMLFTGLTMAYFTDTAEATNTFTVGDVSIELIESTYHRANENKADGAEEMVPNDEYAQDNSWTGKYYTDDVIKTDAEQYQNYLAEAGKEIVPGERVMKNPYVVNTGKNDAYVRVRVLLPVELDPYVYFMHTSTALNNGEIVMGSTSNITYEGKAYVEYPFTYTKVLETGDMTFWNCMSQVWLADTMTQEQVEALNLTDSTFDVVILADAIQAEGFDDATAAFAAFDAQ